jgi:hypothetical protein
MPASCRNNIITKHRIPPVPRYDPYKTSRDRKKMPGQALFLSAPPISDRKGPSSVAEDSNHTFARTHVARLTPSAPAVSGSPPVLPEPMRGGMRIDNRHTIRHRPPVLRSGIPWTRRTGQRRRFLMNMIPAASRDRRLIVTDSGAKPWPAEPATKLSVQFRYVVFGRAAARRFFVM